MIKRLFILLIMFFVLVFSIVYSKNNIENIDNIENNFPIINNILLDNVDDNKVNDIYRIYLCFAKKNYSDTLILSFNYIEKYHDSCYIGYIYYLINIILYEKDVFEILLKTGFFNYEYYYWIFNCMIFMYISETTLLYLLPPNSLFFPTYFPQGFVSTIFFPHPWDDTFGLSSK